MVLRQKPYLSGIRMCGLVEVDVVLIEKVCHGGRGRSFTVSKAQSSSNGSLFLLAAGPDAALSYVSSTMSAFLMSRFPHDDSGLSG